MEWKPIYTAPRPGADDDNEYILLCRVSKDHATSACIREGFWFEREDGSGYWASEWCQECQNEPQMFVAPTHWQPLPEPPTG